MDGVGSDIAATDNAQTEASKAYAKPETDTIKIQENPNHENGAIEDDENQKTNHEKLEQESRKMPQGNL